MLITERDLENICIALMTSRDPQGRLTAWGSHLSSAIFGEFIKEGRVTFVIEGVNHATQIRQEQKNSLEQYLRTRPRPAPCEDGKEVRREEGAEDRRSDSLGQSAKVGREERPIVYIAGPMTGLPDHNVHAFHAAAAHYRARGHAVLNPAEINTVSDGRPLLEIIQRDLSVLLLCNTIYMLRGWENSAGARTEHAVAEWTQMTIIYEGGNVNHPQL